MLSQLRGLFNRMIRVRADRGRKGKFHESAGLLLAADTVVKWRVVDRDIRPFIGLAWPSRKADTPRSTEPPMADRDLRRRFCWRRGWLAIRSTSSKSSADETRLVTKAVSKTVCLQVLPRR